jgi:replicative DNA helicase
MNAQVPHDPSAERSVIGAALLAPDFTLARVSDLRSDEFMDPCHVVAWEAVLELSRAGKPIDVLSVGDAIKRAGDDGRFEGGFRAWAVAAASEVPTAANVEFYAGIVHDKATLRRALMLCSEVAARAMGGETAESVVAQARVGVADLEMRGAGTGPELIGDSLSSAIEVISSRCNPESRHLIPSGISTLDAIIGGFGGQEDIIIAGRPGMGKTSAADCFADHASESGFPVLYFSLEMSRQQMVERMLSIRSGLPASWMRKGRDDKGEPLGLEIHNRILSAGGKLERLPLHIDDRNLSVDTIFGETRRWHARQVVGKKLPMGLVVLDYLQLLRVDNPRDFGSREQQVAHISRTVKLLAKAINCPVCTLCQMNRAVETRGGEPILADLRESGSLEQDADIVIFVHRDINPEDPMSKNQDGTGKLIVAKNRGGACGAAPVNWLAKTMQFTARDDRHAGYEGPDTRGDAPPDWRDGR